jgi:hypothetical protein
MRKCLLSATFFFMMFLVGCSSIPADNLAPVSLFNVSESCPNVCWLGIQPGVTTAEEAYQILLNSKYIDRKSVDWYKSPNEWYPDGISARWLTEPPRGRYVDVVLNIENDKILTMWFDDLWSITLQELINIFGEPDKISIFYVRYSPGWPYIEYTLFYHVPEITVHFFSLTELTGPDPGDVVNRLILNQSDFENPGSDYHELYEDSQPWLGYGHLEEYLPDEEKP